ncbi:hypothetical protein L0337_09370 [candidate division KSB1 bacterium]|nr:hypothetical protein [candidate division KSB1 bacterium]
MVDHERKESPDFLLAEYSALRDEILKRIEIGHQLGALVLVAVGTFLPIGIQGSVTILLAYPLLAMFIATAWSHNDIRIQQIATYIKDIEKKLLPDKGGWEHFFREKIKLEKEALALLASRGIFIGTQALAVIVSLLKKNLQTEDFVFLALDGLAMIFTLYLLRRYEGYEVK